MSAKTDVATTEPTEAEVALTAEVDQLRTALADVTKDRNAWRDARMADKEAHALNLCVKALDEYTGAGSTTSYRTGIPDGVGRVLRYLAERYGVDLAPTVQVVGPNGRPLLSGIVTSVGGEVTIVVDRDTTEYPDLGQRVWVSA